jgi:hypothetical protein
VLQATDMLLRGRKPDTTAHVVVWQVGCVGEMGFRRRVYFGLVESIFVYFIWQGYLNKNLATLIGYLQEFYGPDYEVVHYIAAR